MARFFRRAKERWVFAPAVANLAAPTRAEINAGTVLTEPGSSAVSGFAADPTGFRLMNEPIATPDAASSFDKQIPGLNRVDGTPTIVFYDDDAGTAIRTALAEGTAGFVMRMPNGDAVGKRVGVWPVKVAGLNDDLGVLNAGAAATFEVQFSVTAEPQKNGVLPA